MRVIGVSVGAAVVAWIAVVTTFTSGIPKQVGLSDDTELAFAIGFVALAALGVVVRERLATDNRKRKLAAFGTAIQAGSTLIEDLRRQKSELADKDEAQQRWEAWDAANSELVDQDGRPGDHDLYHLPLPVGFLSAPGGREQWAMYIERNMAARLDRLRDIMSRL